MSGANYCNRLLKKADNGTVFIYLFMFRTFYLKYQKKDAIININQGHFQFIKFFEWYLLVLISQLFLSL